MDDFVTRANQIGIPMVEMEVDDDPDFRPLEPQAGHYVYLSERLAEGWGPLKRSLVVSADDFHFKTENGCVFDQSGSEGMPSSDGTHRVFRDANPSEEALKRWA